MKGHFDIIGFMIIISLVALVILLIFNDNFRMLVKDSIRVMISNTKYIISGGK